MKNNFYETPSVEILSFDEKDVITTSGNGFDGEVDTISEQW